jgi:hypothetical protein
MAYLLYVQYILRLAGEAPQSKQADISPYKASNSISITHRVCSMAIAASSARWRRVNSCLFL